MRLARPRARVWVHENREVTMALLEKWAPFGELDLIDRRMRRMFAGLGVVPAVIPATDVYEADDELVLELEVPGFDEKDLAIEVIDHTLTVKGERSADTEVKDKTLRLQERLETSFERSFVLPTETDSEHLTATYGKGVLTLHVPKTAQATPRKIEIARS
jgi:HSP20 family protein